MTSERIASGIRLLKGTVGGGAIIFALFIAYGTLVIDRAPRRLMKDAEKMKQQGKFEESVRLMKQALEEARKADVRNQAIEAMSRRFTSPEYYAFWKGLYESAPEDGKRWPPYYRIMQQVFSFDAMFKCDDKAAREFGLVRLKDDATPDHVRDNIERKLKKGNDSNSP